VLATVAEKAAAHAAGADAVDLESAAVARAAAAAGLPFSVLRAICDEAGRALPRAAVVALDAKGRIGAGRVLGALLRQPGDIFALVALGRDAGRARTALLGRVGATSLIRGAA
jgi:adenosylhomocysteine nucleosidase